jgi:hypothetical protein
MKRSLLLICLLMTLIGCKSKIPYSVVITFSDMEDIQMITGSANSTTVSGKVCKRGNPVKCTDQTVTLNKHVIDDRLFSNHDMVLNTKKNRDIIDLSPTAMLKKEYFFQAGNCQIPLSPAFIHKNDKIAKIKFFAMPDQLVSCYNKGGEQVYNGSRRQIKVINSFRQQMGLEPVPILQNRTQGK